MSFDSELREAEQMVTQASALVGRPRACGPPEQRRGQHAPARPTRAAAARHQRHLDPTEPPPFAAIRDLWTGSFGFTVTSEDADSVHLAKGDMLASINQGLAAADGKRNVWFGVTTGLHPAAEVPEPG